MTIYYSSYQDNQSHAAITPYDNTPYDNHNISSHIIVLISHHLSHTTFLSPSCLFSSLLGTVIERVDEESMSRVASGQNLQALAAGLDHAT